MGVNLGEGVGPLRAGLAARPEYRGREMGKLDRRHSLKMNRRKAQAKKKARLMRPKSAKALAAVAGGATTARATKAPAVRVG